MIHRAPNRNRWVTMDNRAVEDSRLSLKAKGLLAYLLSRPDNWRASPEHLARTTSSGEYAIRNALRELRDRGYAKLTCPRGDKGLIAGTEWVISELPTEIVVSPMSGKTESRKSRVTEFPHANNDLKETKTEKKQSLVATTQLRWSVAGGWEGLSDDLREDWKKAFPACDIDRQLAAMTQWLRANSAKAQKKNWLRFAVNWLGRNQERGGDVPSRRGNPREQGESKIDRQYRELMERRAREKQAGA